jgi:hypothetical protein
MAQRDNQKDQAQKTANDFKAVFLSAILSIRSSLDKKKLFEAIDKKDPVAIMQLLDLREFGDKLSIWRLASARSAIAGLEEALASLGISSLDTKSVLSHPEYLASISESISTVSNTTQKALVALILALLAANTPKRAFVSSLIRGYGLSTIQNNKLAKYKNSLIDSGLPPAIVNERVSSRANILLRERANRVASNEAFKFYQMGKDLAWDTLIQEGRVDRTYARKWITSVDELTCERCRPMNGQISSANGSFVTGDGAQVRHSPAHPECRCSVILVNTR